ncbi:MAG: aldehyde ferredoxin oxidoreductase family protein [Chloroflexi bacterium]|nr:aldehyde ferredoxin oxidoreductase family protein [Chloroflexota bacterium]
MTHICGWMGTILRVDLTTGAITREPFTEEDRINFIGGYGIGSKILYDETGPETNPIGPESRVIISSGPLTGTLAFGSSRTSIMLKSPETDIIGYTSGGGHFASELKYAGYDAIVIQGKSPEPVYLWIEDDRVELRSAGHLWGKTASQMLALLQEKHGPDIRSLGIGPAGENLVKFACAVTDDLRTPGGCGTGCVMGSKNLKVIAVKGSKTIAIADPERVFEIEKDALAMMKTRLRYEEAHTYGTTTLIAAMGAGGSLPVRNYQYSSESPTYGAERWKRLTHDYIVENYPHKWTSCFGCPVRCAAWVDLDERFGRYACQSSRPEGGALLCGTVAEVDSYAAIVAWNELCDQYGLGIFETNAAIAGAMEWYERGLISKEQTDGLEIKFGDADVMMELTHKIARREGFGNILAEGFLKGGKLIGVPEEYLPHGKGRSGDITQVAGIPAMQLGYAVASRGWDHLSGTDASAAYSLVSGRRQNIYDKAGVPADRTKAHPGMAVMTIVLEDEIRMADIVGTCKFSGTLKLNYDKAEGDMPYYADILSAVTGVRFDPEGLILTAERLMTLQKAYNVRLGLGRQHDQVHVRFREPKSGPLKGVKFSQEDYDRMLSRYYELHGWDPDTGIPRRDTLDFLGLKQVADDLEERGTALGTGGHRYDINDISLEMRGIKKANQGRD